MSQMVARQTRTTMSSTRWFPVIGGILLIGGILVIGGVLVIGGILVIGSILVIGGVLVISAVLVISGILVIGGMLVIGILRHIRSQALWNTCGGNQHRELQQCGGTLG